MNLRMPSILATGFAVALASAAFVPPARAADCAGFADVADTANYCAAVTFVQSRGITVGCTDTAHFCPDQVVSRSQMAIFMSRLANVATPLLMNDVEYYLGGDLDPGFLFIHCSLFIPAKSYPRTVRVQGTWFGNASAEGSNVKMFYNPNDEGLFDLGGFSLPTPVSSSAPVAYSTELYLEANVPYQVSMGPTNDSGDTLTISDSQCTFDVLVANYIIPPNSADHASSAASRAASRAVRAPR